MSRSYPKAAAGYLVEFGSDSRQESRERAQRLEEELRQKSNTPATKLLDDPKEVKKIWQVREAADLVVKYGGSSSGEHGDGQARAELLPKMYGDELVEAFREFKRIWDPQWKMNPGKMVDPYRIDENLRLGAHYQPAQPRTHFS